MQAIQMQLDQKQKTFAEFFLNTLQVGALEKVSFSNTQNPKTVC